MIFINPKTNNNMPTRAFEPPIWCALMAKEGDIIYDNDVEELPDILAGLSVVVAMGVSPSSSSTPKTGEAERLVKKYNSSLTGLHPIAMGLSNFSMPIPSELQNKKRAMWELLPMERYKAHNWHCLQDIDNRGKYAALYTSYGCPFNCGFCNVHTLYGGRKVYYRKPIDVAEEIDFLVRNYGTKNIKFCDEMFTLNHKHVLSICELIKEYHLNIWAYARIGSVNPPVLEAMKSAGINWLAYGIESASVKVRKESSKRYRGMRETIRMTHEAGISVMGNFMFGLPGDTLETMEETRKLAQELECEYVNFWCTMAYPGSDLYKGENKNWSQYNQYSINSKPMGTKYLSPQQILSFRDEAFLRHFTDPKYLEMLTIKFGVKARDHVENMIQSSPPFRSIGKTFEKNFPLVF